MSVVCLWLQFNKLAGIEENKKGLRLFNSERKPVNPSDTLLVYERGVLHHWVFLEGHVRQ